MRSFYLSKDEKHVLYWKYKVQGLTNEESNERINTCQTLLNNLIRKLRSHNKSDKYIADRFKQEFEKICMKMEALD